MRRTKIVCTIGPSVSQIDQMEKIIAAGMNVARINLSHGRREDHFNQIKMLRTVAKKMNKTIGILLDTRGPEVRTGDIEEEIIMLNTGERITLSTEKFVGNNKRISVTYDRLHKDLDEGSRILIDDGLIELVVEQIVKRDIICRIINGGELSRYKGLNTPGTRINLPAIDKEDAIDIEMALDNEVNYLAASFTRTAEDVLEIRALTEKLKGNIMILAKIESREGVENFTSILEVSDGVMVARGDLGVEIEAEEVPLLQKEFIRKCNHAGKPVITATQMLDSMIRNPRPTRAEASDVANAILDGTDAVMLSGETAIGKYPIEATLTMDRIATHTESGVEFKKIMERLGTTSKQTVTDAISYATCHIANELHADAVITATQSGHTARMVSKYRPCAPIIAVSSRRLVAEQLTLTWGVCSVICPPVKSTDDMFNNAIETSLNEGLISDGNLVVITAGVPVGVSGTTNLLRVETVGSIIASGMGIGKKAVSGRALIVRDSFDLEDVAEDEIIVIASSSASIMPAIKKGKALITEEGGLTSHGAIVAINLGKAAIVGVEKATALIKPGEIITLDPIRGLIYRGKANVL